MKLSTKLLAGAAVALSLCASAASATVLISFDGTSAVTGGTFADGAYNFTANCTTGCGGFAGVQVSGDTDALPTLLHSATVDATANGAAANLTVFVTRTGLSSSQFKEFASSFTSNNTPLFPAPTTPFTVTMTTFVSPTDALFGGDQLSSFTNNSTGSVSSNQLAFQPSGGGEYSVTEEYHIVATPFASTESTSPTIILSGIAAVPEPATWGLMIVGFGGMGAMLRRRRPLGVAA